jgi:hypothetical protein
MKKTDEIFMVENRRQKRRKIHPGFPLQRKGGILPLYERGEYLKFSL